MSSAAVRRSSLLVAVVALVGGCGQGAPPASSSSTDGRVAFAGALPGDRSGGVLVLDLASGEQVRVGDQREAWSWAWAGPEHLAVVQGPQRIRDDGAGELVLAPADGSAPGTPVGGVADVLEVASGAGGDHLAFLGRTAHSSSACLDPAPTAPMGLYLSAGDGSGVRRVADVATASHALALSADGRTAALLDAGDDATVPAGRDWCGPGDPRLLLVDTTTGAVRVVEGLPLGLGSPRFSPDGTTLALDAGDYGQQERDVFLVDVATAAVQRLQTPGVAEAHPVFSPDGTSLAVLRHDATGDPAATATVAVGAADGTGVRDVVATGTQDDGLAWTSDGRHLVVAGAVVEMDCADGPALLPDVVALAAPAGGCDTATATPSLRVVSVDGGPLRLVSDAVGGFDAGLRTAP